MWSKFLCCFVFKHLEKYLFQHFLKSYDISGFLEGEHCFIEPDMKLHKVAPEGWKDQGKESAPALTLTLYVRVKFYPSSVSLLRSVLSDSSSLDFLKRKRFQNGSHYIVYSKVKM